MAIPKFSLFARLSHFFKSLKERSIIAVMATIVSLCSLFVSIFNTQMQLRQQRATVWPNLIIYTSTYQQDSVFKFGVGIENQGVGPAIITSTKVKFEGKDYPDIAAAVSALFQKLGRDTLLNYSSHNRFLRSGMSIVPDREWNWLEMNDEAAKVWSDHMNDIKIYIEYRSLYGEEWMSSFNDSDLPEAKKKLR